MIVRAKAPMRISFAGGGTDTEAYMKAYGGRVISATINRYAYATVESIPENTIEIVSIDFGTRLGFPLSSDIPYDGQLDLIKTAIRKLWPVERRRCGIRVTTYSDIGPGSGLGSSSAMVVALVGALSRFTGASYASMYEVAELAVRLERVELGIKGGWQDQYAAAFGGFNFIEFGPKVVVNSLRISKDTLNELSYHLVLVDTGDTRNAGVISEELVKPPTERPANQIEASHRQKALAISMKEALLRGELDRFGRLLHEGWLAKREMATKITNPRIDELYECGLRVGALGGKLLGAGGGGHMLFYIDPSRRRKLKHALADLGASVVDFAFDLEGLQTWQLAAAPAEAELAEVAI